MEAPIIEGNRKKIKVVNPLNKLLIPLGELTILDEPVLTVNESNKPAVPPEINKAKSAKIPKYM